MGRSGEEGRERGKRKGREGGGKRGRMGRLGQDKKWRGGAALPRREGGGVGGHKRGVAGY